MLPAFPAGGAMMFSNDWSFWRIDRTIVPLGDLVNPVVLLDLADVVADLTTLRLSSVFIRELLRWRW